MIHEQPEIELKMKQEMTKKKAHQSWLGWVVASIFLGGCAHSINVSPSMDAVAKSTSQAAQKKIGVSVGYYISEKNRQLEVTTPGGGGDNVRYYPYEALEVGYRAVLTSLYRDAAISNSDKPNSNDRFDYVLEPTVVTNSGSTGFFTWPPTNFSVDITNTIRDSSGRVVANPRVVGVGTAETGERLGDHGFAGRRAMEDALIKTHVALRQVVLERNGLKREQSPIVLDDSKSKEKIVVQPHIGDVEERLRRLKDLKDKGLITNKDYDVQKKSILDAL